MASISARISSLYTTSSELKFVLNCSRVVAPIMFDTKNGRLFTNANAITVGSKSCLCASSKYRSVASIPRGLKCRFSQPNFECPIEQIIRILYTNCPSTPVSSFCQMFHNAPRRFVGQAKRSNLAGFNLIFHRIDNYRDRCPSCVIRMMRIAKLAKVISVSLRPVGLE